MALTIELRNALYTLIEDLMNKPTSMQRLADELRPVTRDNTEVAFGIFVGYVTGGFAEIFFKSQNRSMIRSEVAEVKEIVLQRALEMKKAIAHARAQEM
ncbi:MAG: hypothetical protein E6K91_03605 [Thaumarchaeota archaeon]|nr:MAG: hypothetical protein E6K91_03605 [Nitrososphaerota archaeon]